VDDSGPKVHVFQLSRVLKFQFLSVELVSEIMLLKLVLEKREWTGCGHHQGALGDGFLRHGSDELGAEVKHFGG